MKIALFGAGNVASHLYRAFSEGNYATVSQLFSRDPAKADFVSSETEVIADYAQLKDADLYLLAVSDDGIAEIAEKLEDRGNLVAHTSGSTGMEVLKKFQQHGVFYPLQTFSKSGARLPHNSFLSGS